MKKLQLGKDALILAILTLITVLTWIGFDLYQIWTKTEIPRVLQRQTAPLNPKISATTLEDIRQRTSFTPEELSEVTVPLLEEELEEEEEFIEETTIESGPIATEGGTLEE